MCKQKTGVVQVRSYRSGRGGQGSLFSSQRLTRQFPWLPGMFRPLHMQRHVLQPRRLLNYRDGAREHARSSRRARRLSLCLATQDADVDPRRKRRPMRWPAAGNNISPTQHASHYSTTLSIFSAPELLFFSDETQPAPWRTLTALTALGKIRPSPRPFCPNGSLASYLP